MERLKSIIYKRLCDQYKDYEFFNYGDSVFILDRDSENYLSQYNGTSIFYNDELVKDTLNIFDLDIFDRYEILEPWFVKLFNIPIDNKLITFSSGSLWDLFKDEILNSRRIVGVKIKDICLENSYNMNKDKVLENLLREDLRVWFGTKKKTKDSSQPKGPWVNICRKNKDGKHPPCGRPEAKDTGYPKCRAANVASKMSDSEKKSACQQKRTAEKTNPKSGTGNKPKMVSHKQKNESIVKLIKKILVEQLGK
jgi:hypothetical protein